MAINEDNQSSKRRRVDGKGVAPDLIAKAVDDPDDPPATSTQNACGIPASVWARALSAYLPYEDVRSCSATCRLFAERVAPLIDRLYVLRPSELRTVPAERYAAVEEIFVYSLTAVDVEHSDEKIYETELLRSFALDAKTAFRVVPFVACFPKLTYVFLGGYDGNDDAWGNQNHRSSNEDRTRTDLEYWKAFCTTGNHEDIFRGLVMNLCAAYYSGVLSQNVHVEGVFTSPHFSQDTCSVETTEDGGVRTDPTCEFCREICATFPISTVFSLRQRLKPFKRGLLCISDRDRFSIIAQRPGGRAILQCKENAIRLLGGYTFGEARISGSDLTYPCHGREALDQIKLLCEEFGLDPKQIDGRSLFLTLFSYALEEDDGVDAKGIPLRKDLCILRQTRDYLQNLGFKVPSEIRVIDHEGTWITEQY